jgi:hypothetical protein
MEDDLKILKVKYLSNLLLDRTQILYLSLDDQTILYKLRLRWPKQTVQIENNIKILKWNNSATAYWIILKF